MEEMDGYWNNLVRSACNGNASEMMALKRFDIMDFFDYVDNKLRDGGR